MSAAFILCPSRCYCQKENNIWYFGLYAGIDFNSSPPKVLTDGKLKTNEGCATVCDASGKLLFYTDGVTVWDKNHDTMPNGFDLKGHFSSTQSATIVKNPGNKHQYYIFTVGSLDKLGLGIHYSIVDIRANNGLGDVIQKNTVLNYVSAAEKLIAVKDYTGCGFWIIYHGYDDNRFYSHHLTAAGIEIKPVVSQTGLNYAVDRNVILGYLKASPDGQKLAACLFNYGLELFNFDKNTGAVSGGFRVDSTSVVYGASFSPNSRLLYAINYNNMDLYQYDVSSFSPNAVKASVKLISSRLGCAGGSGALQIAPDGKIYVSKFCLSYPVFKYYLGVINNPDVAGPGCNYSDTGLNMPGTNIPYLGLPEIVETPLSTDGISLGPDTAYCGNLPILLTPVKPVTGKFTWCTGDTSQTLPVSKSGQYWLEVSTTCGIIKDTIIIKRLADTIDLGNDTLLCSAANFDIKVPNLAGTAYQWNTGDTIPTIKINKTGIYSIKIKTPVCNEELSDSIRVQFFTPLPFRLPPDISSCENTFKAVELKPIPSNYTSYLWNDGTVAPALLATREGKYTLTATDTCGNMYTAETEISLCNCQLYIPTAFTPNGDGNNDLYTVANPCGLTSFGMQIFNRWGELLFSTTNPKAGWDGTYNGKQAPQDIYMVIINYNFAYAGKRPDYTGTITLLR